MAFKCVEYATIPCNNGTSIINLSALNYGSHRFEVRAVLMTGAVDLTPAIYDWEVVHCNDPNHVPQQYASIETNGGLTCIDCPHPDGSNCRNLDVTWMVCLLIKVGGLMEP